MTFPKAKLFQNQRPICTTSADRPQQRPALQRGQNLQRVATRIRGAESAGTACPREGPTRVLADLSLAGDTDAGDPKQGPALAFDASQPQNHRSHGTWAGSVALP